MTVRKATAPMLMLLALRKKRAKQQAEGISSTQLWRTRAGRKKEAEEFAEFLKEREESLNST